jgi:predicted small lipoprotein YifL
MQESIVNKSHRRRIARRIGAAVMALAAVLTLGACRATGGGYLPPGGVFQGQADFGFNFTCEVETEKKRAVIRGEVTYHDYGPVTVGLKTFPNGIRLHGTVDPFFIPEITSCAEADVLAGVEGLGYARFQGEYRSQDTTLPTPTEQGRFQVDVQDMGEPPPSLEGDSFDILLTGGEYPAYNRFGFVEGGNIQVEDD